jgi:predicted nucleic acid-binding protein
MGAQVVKIADALQGVARLFLDTAPVIYYVENNPHYFTIVEVVFDHIDNGSVIAVTSPVTLAESLVVPYRSGAGDLQQAFFDLITQGQNTIFVPIDRDCGRKSAELRARYNLTLADALQIAVALSAGCEAFLTNDAALNRVAELRILILDELEL